MAWRIADLVTGGELDNTIKGRVVGWINLSGRAEPLQLHLTGNCRPDLAGWRFRICRLEPVPAWAEPPDMDGFATMQSGQVGDITADRVVRHYDCPPQELLARMRAGEPPPEELRESLYLEWYSEANGRVVIEETRLGVERIGTRTFELTAADLRREAEQAEDKLDELRESGFVIEETEMGVMVYRRDDDDPDRLLADDLQSQLDHQNREIDRAIRDSLDDTPPNED